MQESYWNAKDFFEGNSTLQVDKNGKPSQRDVRVATVALLLVLAHADKEFDANESREIVGAMCRHFNIMEDQEVGELMEIADYVRKDPKKLDTFTQVVKDNFNQEQKILLLGMVWRVIKADGLVSKLEAVFARELRGKLGLTLEQAVLAQRQAEQGQV